MPKKYRLRQTLLMPGMMPIILPIGYEVELKGDRYSGEGGWYFATHGVEDNKYHWGEIKEKEWEIVEYLDDELVTDIAKRKIIPKNDFRWNIAVIKNFPIHSVKRLSDGEVFTVGDFIKVKSGDSRKGWSDVITSFVIVERTMVAVFGTWRQPLNDIERMHKDIQVTQPLSGEFISKEECERREREAFSHSRFFLGGTAINTFYDIAMYLRYPTFEDYKQSLK